MHPSGRTGVRFVLANPSDPSRLDDFSDWYDTYSAAITVPGYLVNDVRFENPDASGENTSPRYATIYDIVTPDPLHAYPRAASQTLPAPQIRPQLSESFRLAGMLVAKDS
jgi:hypothetical protein